MKNKILIKLTSPELDMSYDLFIPQNESIMKIKTLLCKFFSDYINTDSIDVANIKLINRTDARIYKNRDLIYETNIKNATELIVIF